MSSNLVICFLMVSWFSMLMIKSDFSVNLVLLCNGCYSMKLLWTMDNKLLVIILFLNTIYRLGSLVP